MGSKGSVHIQNKEQEKIVEFLLAEYNKENSWINHDKTHNGHGKPMIIIGKDWISIYDGSFGISGDLQQGQDLTKMLGVAAMGIVNLNDDIVGIMLMDNGQIVFDADIDFEGWMDETSPEEFRTPLELPYSEDDITDLFEAEDNMEFLEKFHQLTNCPFYMDYEWLSQPEEYLELIEETENLNVYRKLKPFQWDADYYSPR